RSRRPSPGAAGQDRARRRRGGGHRRRPRGQGPEGDRVRVRPGPRRRRSREDSARDADVRRALHLVPGGRSWRADDRVSWLHPDGRKLLAARALRAFGYGYLAVVLAIYLQQLGLSGFEIGIVLTAAVAGTALMNVAWTLLADRF